MRGRGKGPRNDNTEPETRIRPLPTRLVGSVVALTLRLTLRPKPAFFGIISSHLALSLPTLFPFLSHPLPLLDPGPRTFLPWVLLRPILRLHFHTQTFLSLPSRPLLDSWRIIVSTLPPVHSADDLQSSRCYPSLSRPSKLDSPPPNSRYSAGPPHRLQNSFSLHDGSYLALRHDALPRSSGDGAVSA